MHIKAEGMTQFEIIRVFVENSVNFSELRALAFSELYSNQPESESYTKMLELKNAHVWAA